MNDTEDALIKADREAYWRRGLIPGYDIQDFIAGMWRKVDTTATTPTPEVAEPPQPRIEGKTGTPVGHVLKAYRVLARMTQREVAARAGISRSRLSRIEGDRTHPGWLEVCDIARAVGVKIDTLG